MQAGFCSNVESMSAPFVTYYYTDTNKLSKEV